jgi:L-seryl-tRNA(Ser) seleniumtransferase
MLATTPEALCQRAEALAAAIGSSANASADVMTGVGYLGSGSLPMEQLPTFLVAVSAPSVKAQELARLLRMDDACIFARIEDDKVMLDVRTMTDEQIAPVAAAVARAAP